MHVKDLAARYEAVARKEESGEIEENVLNEVLGIGQVKKIADQLERAVKEAKGATMKKEDQEGEEIEYSKFGEDKEGGKSDSPRGVETADFGEARGLMTVVPESVAEVGKRDERGGLEERVKRFEPSVDGYGDNVNMKGRKDLEEKSGVGVKAVFKHNGEKVDKVTSGKELFREVVKEAVGERREEWGNADGKMAGSNVVLEMMGMFAAETKEEIMDGRRVVDDTKVKTSKSKNSLQGTRGGHNNTTGESLSEYASFENDTASNGSNFDSSYESGTYLGTRSLELIEPIEDVSDGDLDDIEGVERVDDFDSQEELHTLNRQETVEILSDNGEVPPLHSPQEFTSDDGELDGYQAPPVHVEDSESDEVAGKNQTLEQVYEQGDIIFGDGRSSGIATVLNSQAALEQEAITSVEDEFEECSDNESFASADEEFPHTSRYVGWQSRVSSSLSPRRPRVKSMGVATVSKSAIGRVPAFSTGGSALSRGSLNGRVQSSRGLTHGVGPVASGRLPMRESLSVKRVGMQGAESLVGRHSTDRGQMNSLKRLPKAKVLIARRRGHSVNLGDSEVSDEEGQPKAHGTMSLDGIGVGARRLVREYSNPSELLTGQVSMVEMVKDEEREIGEGKYSVGLVRRHGREEEYKRRYDEFIDVEELGNGKGGLVYNEDESLEDDVGKSKEQYRRRKRLFGGSKGGSKDKEKMRRQRQEKHVENVQRRSEMLSGALDRVSMAADPWIEFITDANTVPGGRRPFRNAMKRMFRRGKGDVMIKN